MTTLSPLHVVLPSEPDVVTPPTPYTPKSASFVNHSDLSQPPSLAPDSSTTRLSSMDSKHNQTSEMKHADDDRVPAVCHSGPDPPDGGESEPEGQEIVYMEMRVTAPGTLPPSPPLTDNEGREEDKKTTPQNLLPVPNSPDEDIHNWQSSVDEREGSYHEDDLGYSTEVSPVEFRGVPGLENAKLGGVSTDGIPPTPTRNVSDHPLRLDDHAPSPPPWETIDPPENNNNPILTNGAFTRQLKPATSRPLIPHSSYYFGPPPLDSAFGTNPVGQIGLHHPREIVRIERDYSGGEIIQFAPVYPLELEGRITPTQFLETINSVNEVLISAHSLRHSFVDSALSFFTLHLSRLVTTSHYEKEMERLQQVIGELNRRLYNPVGLNIMWPRRVAFMFLEIEYY